MAFFGSSLSTFPEMSSNPGALRMLVCASASTTSSEEKGLMGRDIWHGISKKAVISASVGFGRWWG